MIIHANEATAGSKENYGSETQNRLIAVSRKPTYPGEMLHEEFTPGSI